MTIDTSGEPTMVSERALADEIERLSAAATPGSWIADTTAGVGVDIPHAEDCTLGNLRAALDPAP